MLSGKICDYYFNNLGGLSADKQFHYASRLAAWKGDPRAFELLTSLRPSFTFDGSRHEIKNKISQLLGSDPQKGRRNAHELRLSWFEKYPDLYGSDMALFRVRHLKYIYGLGSIKLLYECRAKKQLDELASSLTQDRRALAILSTFAVNFLYLYKVILLDDPNFIDLEYFLSLEKEYDLNNIKHLQLLIYLFTHCIIGETNFYIKEIKPARIEPLKKMLTILENLITQNFSHINLDNKLEFLMCCRICSYQTSLEEKIYAECQQSVSSDGHFLIDTHNSNAQEDRATFEKSEHRNVLFIMSNSEYTPHSTLITE